MAGYNQWACERQITAGDWVFMLLPNYNSKFMALWQGPYEVIQQTDSVNCEVWQPGRCKTQQVYDNNLLKRWEALLVTTRLRSGEFGPGVPE